MAERHDEDDEARSFLDGLISQETRRRTREQTQPLIDAFCTPGCIRTSVVVGCIVALVVTTLIIVINKTNTKDPEVRILRPTDPPYWMLNQATEEQLQTHMRYLSSDMLEGRAPGTRGEALTASYISSHFRAAGLHPLPSSQQPSLTADPFIQIVPMIGVTVLNTSNMIITMNQTTFNYTNADFTIDSETGSTTIDFRNTKMAFAGHCMNMINDVDPEVILICLTTSMSNNSDYDGLLSKQLAYLRSKRPLGVLLVEDQDTGYPWEVYQRRFGAGEQLSLEANQLGGLPFKGWISYDLASKIASLNGIPDDVWKNFDKRLHMLGTTLTLRASLSVRTFNATNVVAYLGPSPSYSNSKSNPILLVAHHDYLGIRGPIPGFSSESEIHNGAIDNASGVSALLTAAYSIAALYKEPFIINPGYDPLPLQRSIIFMTATGSQGMLGLSHFVKGNITCSSVLSFEVMNLWDNTKSADVVGKNMSSLMNSIADSAIAGEFMKSTESLLVADIYPWPFIAKGVPSIGFAPASDWDPDPVIEYKAKVQYRPDDKFTEKLSTKGLLKQVRIALRILFSLAINDHEPRIDNTDFVNFVW